MAVVGAITVATMKAYQTQLICMLFFYRKRILLLREATTKPWKAGDRIKKYTVIPNRTEKANTRGLDREIYHLLRKLQAKIH